MTKNCIFVASYPNTEDKIRVLEECINSIKRSGIPVVSISNISLPERISSKVENCLFGINEECRYQDFLSDEEIDKARNYSRYLLHFIPPGDDAISYRPFYYGRGSTYHWAGLTQQFEIIKYSLEQGITHAFIMEGDVILEDDDVHKISEYFSTMEEEKLDFIVAMQNGFEHMSGNGWFTTIEYWERVCSEMSARDFIKSTWPSFSSEGYVISKMKKSEGNGNLLMWEDDSYPTSDLPGNWRITKTKKSEDEINQNSINLFFPETKRIGLSSSTDRKDQSPEDPLTYVPMGIGRKLDLPVFFIWNRYNGETVKSIKAKVSIFNEDSLIFNSEYDLSPGYWAWTPIYNMMRNSYCKVDIMVFDVQGNKFMFSDKFGSVGDNIDMRDLIFN